jgi:hypothetical protein
MKTKWIECICTDSDHAIRILKDDECFYFDMKFSKHSGNGFLAYIKGIWRSLVGLDNRYMTQWAGSDKEAKQLADFIYSKIN